MKAIELDASIRSSLQGVKCQNTGHNGCVHARNKK